MERDQALKFMHDLLRLMSQKNGSDPVSYTHLPARQIGKTQAGGDADDQLLLQMFSQRCAGFLHLLRLDGQQQGVALKGDGLKLGIT